VSGGVLVVGGGGHAKVVVATLQAAGFEVAAVLDDEPRRHGLTLLGVPIAGPIAALAGRPERRAVLAVGDNRTRRRLAGELAVAVEGLTWVSVAHPAAVVHESVRLGPGSVVFAGAVIQPDCEIGAHAVVNTGASVDHDSTLGDFTHVAPGARLAGGVSLGEGAFLGLGAVVLPGVAVGAWATVGAGAAVTADVAAETTVAGVPARPIAGDDRERTP
jgi:sugar O-acyltransferase (sialic acid O-acetyltransferase NeuD family)